jgi:hypothetical protein
VAGCFDYYNKRLDSMKCNGKVVPVLFFFNSAPRHEGVLGEWRNSATHS